MATTSKSSAPENETLILKSSEGDEFKVPVSAAALSTTIKNMVEDGCAANAIPLANVDAKTLCMIIPFLEKHAAAAAGELSRDDLKKFDDEFASGEPIGDLMDALLAANYLDIRELIELLSMKIAALMKGYRVEEVRELFNIDSDDFLPPAEEEKIKKNYAWAFENLDEA